MIRATCRELTLQLTVTLSIQLGLRRALWTFFWCAYAQLGTLACPSGTRAGPTDRPRDIEKGQTDKLLGCGRVANFCNRFVRSVGPAIRI